MKRRSHRISSSRPRPRLYPNNNKRVILRDQLGREIFEKKRFRPVKYKLLSLGDDADLFKPAILRFSPCLVSIVSLGLPPQMTKYSPFGFEDDYLTDDQVYIGSGTIIECHQNAHDDKFSATILTTASLFIRTDDIQPGDIEVDVYLTEKGAKFKGKVLACDFHYNLALVAVQINSPVQPPKLRDLDDIFSIQLPTNDDDSQSFQLRPHSTLFKIRPGDKVAAVARFTDSRTVVSYGQFSARPHPGFDCKQLYSISVKDSKFQDTCGSPIINHHGEVIGILTGCKNFLPSNIVSRWWAYYKNLKKYCRPWLGLNVANLKSAKLKFLEFIVQKFPNVSSGVIVTKVVENSPAFTSGMLRNDVIVQCNGETISSTLDLFDKIWDKVGEPVELSILRKADRVNVKVTVEEAKLDNFFNWPVPQWSPRPGCYSSSNSDSEMSV